MSAAGALEYYKFNKINLLQIEDDPSDCKFFATILRDSASAEFDLMQTSFVREGLELLLKHHFDAILLDLNLPDSDGLQTLQTLRSAAPDKPIIVLTGSENEEIGFEAIQQGAQEYLIKGQTSNDLVSRAIRYAIERKRAELDLIYLAEYDNLTGLANRSLFKDRLEQALQHSNSNTQKVALLFIDLDLFKQINDTYGHAVGDLLLQQVALRLKQCLRREDTTARVGGDEFTVILEGIESEDVASAIADKIIARLAEPFTINQVTVSISASIGISVHNGHKNLSADRIYKNSDAAMYQAKLKGGNSLVRFSSDVEQDRHYSVKSRLISGLHDAVDRQEFFICYQPQIDMGSRRIIGGEALIRWQHPELGIVEPGLFIPLLEETGLIIEVGAWVLHTACTQWANWIKEGNVPSYSTVSVNLSPLEFQQETLIDTIENILLSTGLPAPQLNLELTENLFLENTQANINVLNRLKVLGVKLSLDDFGTGFSSLNYLKHFPMDCLKIDRCFVEDILNSHGDAAITASIVGLADNLNMDVIVEGVDSEEKLHFLQEQGCRQFQGYYFSAPLLPTGFVENIRDTHYH